MTEYKDDMRMDVKVALESMVWQFSYRGTKNGKSILYTGGLSALEEAFSALGWSDPKYFNEDEIANCICDVKGCAGWVAAQGGMWSETGYWCLCTEHCEDYRLGKPQPQMKQRAINRENSRDSITRRLP